MEKQPYDDGTVLMWGPHKFTRVSRIPADYLLSLNKANSHDKLLLGYIEANKEKLESIYHGEIPAPKISEKCEKQLFVSQKEAKNELKRIRKLSQTHLKPKREYQCPKCCGWHLTSLSLKEWERKSRSFR